MEQDKELRDRYREGKKVENGARGNPKGSMDRTGGLQIEHLCGLVWRSTMGFYSQGFRFEGGGRQIIGMLIWIWGIVEGAPFNHIILCRFEQNR